MIADFFVRTKIFKIEWILGIPVIAKPLSSADEAIRLLFIPNFRI